MTFVQARLPRRTLPAMMSAELQARVRDGRLPPGCRLTESSLAREFNTSRTVVREAISRLEASGLARSRPGIGTIVLEGVPVLARPLNGDAGREVFIGLVVEAVALAAARRTDDDLQALRAAAGDTRRFHLALARAAHNALYLRLIEASSPAIAPRLAAEAHRPVIQAIERHDGTTAAAALRLTFGGAPGEARMAPEGSA